MWGFYVVLILLCGWGSNADLAIRTNDRPHLTFFCELAKEDLPKLFNNTSVVDQLLQLDATVSLGIRDLSDERAWAVKYLNSKGRYRLDYFTKNIPSQLDFCNRIGCT